MRAKLEDVCTVFSDGDWIESKDQSDKGIRLVQTGNIGEGLYLEKEERAKYVSEETFESLKCTEIYPGDILISRLPEPVGRACIIPPKKERMITAVDCTICRVDESIVSKEYMCYFMRSNAYYTKLLGSVTGTTRKRISRKNLGNIELEIPPKEEQIDVVSQLECLINVINSRNKELQLFDNLIKARFVELFGDIRCNNKLPLVKLSEFANIGSSKRIYANEYVDKGVPFYRSKEIRELGTGMKPSVELYIKQERYDEIKEKYGVPKKGDILIAAIGATIGYSWIVDTDTPFYYKDGNLIILSIKNNVNPIFLNYTMGILIEDFKNKDVAGSAQLALTIEKLEKMMVVNPDIKLQNQFADFVHQVNKSKVKVQKALDETQKLFDSLMQQYFG